MTTRRLITPRGYRSIEKNIDGTFVRFHERMAAVPVNGLATASPFVVAAVRQFLPVSAGIGDVKTLAGCLELRRNPEEIGSTLQRG